MKPDYKPQDAVIIHAPLRVKNPNNGDQGGRRRQMMIGQQRRHERSTVGMAWLAAGVPAWVMTAPIVITLVRCYAGMGRAMDRDGFTAALKTVQDETAKMLGVDDRDGTRVVWVHAQTRTGKGREGVEIVIQPMSRAVEALCAAYEIE
jgi:hypothetical protein